MSPRVRVIRRVIVRAGLDGLLDLDQVRRAADHVHDGDDVVVVIRGRVGVEPGAAGLLGRALAGARTIQVEGTGNYVGLFAATLRDAAELETAR